MEAHNAYFYPPINGQEIYASGPEQHLLDDVYIDRMRGMEIDIHGDDKNGGGIWSVYHTDNPAYSLCSELGNCLEALRAFHYGMPHHDVFFVHIEAKETVPEGHIFNNTNLTTQKFDNLISSELGPRGTGPDWVFGPKDYYAWCREVFPHTVFNTDDLIGTVSTCGWPTVDQLKGKFMITLHGSDPGGARNAEDVYDYSHAGRDISQAKVWPMMSVLGNGVTGVPNGLPCGFRLNPAIGNGVCDESLHSAFADAVADLAVLNFTCAVGAPGVCYGGIADPSRFMCDFEARQGLLRSGDRPTTAGMASAIIDLNLAHCPGQRGHNVISVGNGPRNAVMNFDSDKLASQAFLSDPPAPDWTSGCLFRLDPNTQAPVGTLAACQNPLHEENSTLYLDVTSKSFGMGGTVDNLFYAFTPRLPGAGDFKAFVSTRTDRQSVFNGNGGKDDLGPTHPADYACLMARADYESAGAPYFAMCRHGHEDGRFSSKYGAFLMYRLTQDGPTVSQYLSHVGDNTGITELQNFFKLHHDETGKCWMGYTRSTDDPSPKWGEEAANNVPICFASALAFVGVSLDGGLYQQNPGQAAFTDIKYDGHFLHLLSNNVVPLNSTVVTLNAIQDRSFFDEDLTLEGAPQTVTADATSPQGATVTFTLPTATDPNGVPPPVSCDHMPGEIYPIGLTQVTCSAADPDETNPGPVTATFTVHVKGVNEQLADLLSESQGLGDGRSLPFLVQLAIRQWAGGDRTGACRSLGWYVADVRVQVIARLIPAPRGAQVIADATRIQAVIGC